MLFRVLSARFILITLMGRQQLVLVRCRAQRLIPVLLLQPEKNRPAENKSNIVEKQPPPFSSVFCTYTELAGPPSQKYNNRDSVGKFDTMHKPIWICLFQSFIFPTIYTIIYRIIHESSLLHNLKNEYGQNECDWHRVVYVKMHN